MKPVVLLQTPFFKAAGSHNNRVSLELCYGSRYLEQAGIEHVVVNADYEETDMHHPWRELLENSENYKAACDGKSPVISQSVEQVMQFRPKVVFVAAGDNYIPTKDWGSPYIAYHVADRLRQYVKVIGVGPQYTKNQYPFREPFDNRFFIGPIDRSIVDVAMGRERKNNMAPVYGDVLPQFGYTHPKGQTTDYVMSSFGCNFNCDFCYAPVVWGKVYYRDPQDFVRDVHTRILLTGKKSLYISDMRFPGKIKHATKIAELLEEFDYEFTCESRLNKLKDEDAMLMRDIGVKIVKLGVEALNDNVLRAMNKKQTAKDIKRAVSSYKEAGFQLVGYLLFGSYYDGNVADMNQTIKEAADMEAIDYWVINVASYGNLDWKYRYDCHFSVIAAEQQGVPREVIFKAVDELQEGKKNPTVKTI